MARAAYLVRVRVRVRARVRVSPNLELPLQEVERIGESMEV